MYMYIYIYIYIYIYMAGEDDYRVCLKEGIIAKGETVPCPVDDDGRFTAVVTDFVGMHVKDADKDILAKLKSMGRLVKSGSIKHSYPFCWRSDTPLIYKAVPSWFVKVCVCVCVCVCVFLYVDKPRCMCVYVYRGLSRWRKSRTGS